MGTASHGPDLRRVLALTGELLLATRIRETARQVGAEVEVRPPGPGAAERAAALGVHLILVALEPDGAALEAVKELKADARTRSIPVVATYPHVDVELRRRALEAGCDRVLPRSAFATLLPELLRGAAARGAEPGAGPPKPLVSRGSAPPRTPPTPEEP